MAWWDMAKRTVKPSVQAMTLELHQPKIVIESNIEPMTPKELRIHFAGQIITGLVAIHGDLGGRQDKRLAAAAFALADEMVATYFNT